MAGRREFLLTGVTGFLGKVVLEELLRRREELGVDRVYVVIRPKKQAGPEERFDREVAASACFSRLPADWTQSVSVVEGTLEEPWLGLEPATREELERRVTHILHAAASVSFDLPLDEAARANVATSVNLLELARGCTRLERLVSVSTAYVTPHPGDGVPIAETLAPLPAPAESLYEAIKSGAVSEAELLGRSGHPNTYTLTKSLAEHLLVARRGDIPLTIVRPSIISASWRYPFPGWIDSTAGFGGFVVLIGLGHLRVLVASRATRIDLVPVDEVAGHMLDECRDTTERGKPVIRHAVAGLERSIRIPECADRIRTFFSMHRLDRVPTIGYLGPRGLRFILAEAYHHRLAITVASLRSPALRQAATQLRSRLDYLNRIFPYFTSSSFGFEAARPLTDGFEPGPYVTTVCRGVYRHILKRDETEWTLAGRSHKGFGGDFRWAMSQPHGNLWIRFAAWLLPKVLRRAVDRVTVDIPSFQAARRAAPEGSPMVLVPNHRSYLDFVLGSYLCFARPDLGIGIPHIAATMEFGRIPVLGRILGSLHAFYLRRGTGREDPDLTRRVHALIAEGKTLEFFVEGQRSRSREFLPPKRGLLRCLQATGRTFTLLPVAFSYDRVPEEAVFAAELAGHPKSPMRLRGLLRWALRTWRGKTDLGRIHLACARPVRLGPEDDVQSVSQEIIQRLESATVATTFHLEAFLTWYAIDGMDPAGLRKAIEERGGRVLESPLSPWPGLDPRIAATFRHQFEHLLRTDGHPPLLDPAPATSSLREREPVG